MKFRTYFSTIVFSIFFLQIILVSAAVAANKIMPLGDSITKGSSSGVAANEFQISYRKSLWDRLKTAGYVINDELFVGTLVSGDSVADFDPDHEGHSGWTADEIVNGIPGSGEGKLDEWLIAEEPNIVLLHIGTNDINGNNEDWDEVEAILDVIDAYEDASGKAVWVFLALIIDQSCSTADPPCQNSLDTTAFNIDVRDEVFIPRQNNGDKIVLVDMEIGAFIDYPLTTDNPPGDMNDNLHPFETGYAKMADLWFTELISILPQADAGDAQTVKEAVTVTLDGSKSSDPVTIASYLWEQETGTPVTLPGASPDPTATFTAPNVDPDGETLTFKLTVTDTDGLESTDTVSIEIDTNEKIIGSWGSGIWYWDTTTSLFTNMTELTGAIDIAAGDFNADGIADVASSWGSGLWYQDGSTSAWTFIFDLPPTRVTAGDVTGDGRDEIIGVWDSGIWYWDATAPPSNSFTQMTDLTGAFDIAAGDFNADGIADVASSWVSGLWYQDGSSLAWTFIDNEPPSNVTAGDVTGDGRDEIIGVTDSGIYYWDATAPPSDPFTQMTDLTGAFDIAAGDFNADGIADVASSWVSGLWYQDGSTSAWTFIFDLPPTRVTAGNVTGQ